MKKIRTITVSLTFAILASGLILMAGCGGSKVDRYSLSGEVTYQGKPVPLGNLVFEPDASKGNKGPQGFANIKDGHYTTDKLGRGAISGPLVVQICAVIDPSHVNEEEPSGEGMLNYTTTIDLPKEASTFDFEIPMQKNIKWPSDDTSPR